MSARANAQLFLWGALLLYAWFLALRPFLPPALSWWDPIGTEIRESRLSALRALVGLGFSVLAIWLARGQVQRIASAPRMRERLFLSLFTLFVVTPLMVLTGMWAVMGSAAFEMLDSRWLDTNRALLFAWDGFLSGAFKDVLTAYDLNPLAGEYESPFLLDTIELLLRVLSGLSVAGLLVATLFGSGMSQSTHEKRGT